MPLFIRNNFVFNLTLSFVLPRLGLDATLFLTPLYRVIIICFACLYGLYATTSFLTSRDHWFTSIARVELPIKKLSFPFSYYD